MPNKRIRDFLDDHGIRYDTIPHVKTYTAQRTAQSVHMPGGEVAKTVIVKIDGRLAMAVVPATEGVDLSHLKRVSGAKHVELASETEFERAFPECDLGAMPPFGNLYGMDTWVDLHVSRSDEIAFNAGTHTELIRMRYRDFERVVKPKVADFGFHVGIERG